MIMLGFASQYLKDLLKYGGSTPYVEGPDYVQRGIRASGLLGTGERVLDQFFPIMRQDQMMLVSGCLMRLHLSHLL